MQINDIPVLIAKELGVTPKQTSAAIELLDGGNTVPFIARYRKEATGALEDEQLRTLEERLTYLRNLVKRQEEILGKIEEQGKLTDELKAAIEKAQKLQELEDLYLPYKQKKRTRAQIARERGLEPLAQMMLEQAKIKGTPLEEAESFINAEKPAFGTTAISKRNSWRMRKKPIPLPCTRITASLFIRCLRTAFSPLTAAKPRAVSKSMSRLTPRTARAAFSAVSARHPQNGMNP